MSPIGKIFVVLNFVFSLVVLGVVGAILAKSDEFKKKYTDEAAAHSATKKSSQEELDKRDAEIKMVKEDNVKLNTEKGNLTVSLNTASNDLKSAKVDNEQLRATVEKMQADYGSFTSTLAELKNNNAQLVSKNEELINKSNSASDAQRAAQVDKARADAQVKTLMDTVAQLKAQIEELEGAKSDLSAQLEAAVQAGFDVAKVAAAPQIDGVVQSVNSELGLVVLSVGADDGVKRGTKFEVFANSQYKGQVVVDDVYPDNSAARIVRQVSGSPIAANDKATTRL